MDYWEGDSALLSLKMKMIMIMKMKIILIMIMKMILITIHEGGEDEMLISLMILDWMHCYW